MMAAQDFGHARSAEKLSRWIFYFVAAASGILLCTPGERAEMILKPFLVTAAVVSVVATVVTRFYQNRGNSLLRASQLSDALGAGLAPVERADYYNNSLVPGIARLALTTLENTYLTSAVLGRMLRRERSLGGAYLVLFILLISFRGTGLDVIVLLSQTIFSADLLLSWYRLEWFRYRTATVQKRLYDLFLNSPVVQSANRTALALSAFAEYECAKDEASAALDADDFDAVNLTVSQEWGNVKARLNVHDSSSRDKCP